MEKNKTEALDGPFYGGGGSDTGSQSDDMSAAAGQGSDGGGGGKCRSSEELGEIVVLESPGAELGVGSCPPTPYLLLDVVFH